MACFSFAWAPDPTARMGRCRAVGWWGALLAGPTMARRPGSV